MKKYLTIMHWKTSNIHSNTSSQHIDIFETHKQTKVDKTSYTEIEIVRLLELRNDSERRRNIQHNDNNSHIFNNTT